MPKRKVCVVTGSRADYGLLYWLMKEIQNDSALELQIIATGMHLSPEFGLTYKVIEEDGFAINEKVEMLLSSDSPVGITKSIGLATIGFADALDRQNPDIVVILGDRYESLAAAQAALVAKIPVAHIAGGDITEGAFDDAIRHSITKMSHLHFVSNQVAAARVRQLGERADCVYNVGSPGVDYISRLKLLERKELEEVLDFDFKEKNLLITFHPTTLDDEPVPLQIQGLLNALSALGPGVGIIFTKPNSDPGGRMISRMIDDYVAFHSNTKAYISLGQLYYLSVIPQVDAVIGNSSSGLYEVPSFKKPTVNIGDRQKGRLQASSVINCDVDATSISRAIEEAFAKDCSETINPYGDGDSSIKIKEIIKERQDIKKLLKKIFISLNY